jgi:hypothetical protein
MEKTLPKQQIDDDAIRATAHLPGLKVEIVHRRSPAEDAELISINLQAVPSFEAFGRFLHTASPIALWSQAMQMAWIPWFGIASALMLPSSHVSDKESGLQKRQR